MRFFDSLTHVTRDGSWLGGDRYVASEARLTKELDAVAPARACLVAIAGWMENEQVLEVAAREPERYVPIAGFDPSEAVDPIDAAAGVGALAAAGFAGIKLHSRLNDYDPLDDRALATVTAAGEGGLVVFLDTLLRRRTAPTRRIDDVVDVLATTAPDTRIVLLHGGGSALLDLFEMGRMHPQLIVDVSFTMMRYAGSSIDQDIRFLAERLDRRMSIGSDFPEYTPAETLARFDSLTQGLSEEKRENVRWRNLAGWFPLAEEARARA